MQPLDYLDHLQRESARFAAAVLAAPPDAPVPTCPAWTADDLLWHLAEVQWFWGEIVRSGATDPEPVQAAKPARPDDRQALAEFYRVASAGLLAALAAAEPSDPAWTWSSDRTVGFIRRRQAHEALIHRVDAELVAGERTGMDALLGSDGVDEALRIMYGAWPGWGTFTPDAARAVRISSADTPHAWLAVPGRFTGTEPATGQEYDVAALDVTALDVTALDVTALDATATKASSAGLASAATITGAAADLDCLLWNRPTLGPVERSGDPAALAAFDSVLAEGIE